MVLLRKEENDSPSQSLRKPGSIMEGYKYLMSAPRLLVCIFVLVPPCPHACCCSGSQDRGREGVTGFRRRGAVSLFLLVMLGQYKTSLLECHRKFVHFLLHLAAILLDKHGARLVCFKHFRQEKAGKQEATASSRGHGSSPPPTPTPPTLIRCICAEMYASSHLVNLMLLS